MSTYIVKFDETKISDLRDISNENINDLNFITDFEIKNMPVPLVNTLRRSFSTLCPTVTFDNTYFNNTEFNSIKIINNTSSLHNEFISHRLSLIPINMDNKYFKGLVSTVCNENGERVWKFPPDYQNRAADASQLEYVNVNSSSKKDAYREIFFKN